MSESLERHFSAKIKAIIFDCDGVLIDSEGPSSRATASFAQKYGLALTAEESFKLFAGKAFPDVVKYLREKSPQPIAEDAVEQLRENAIREMSLGAEPIDGAFELLKALNHLDIPVYVGSNSSQAEMKAKFSCTKMDRLLKAENIYSAIDRGIPKPDPDIYLYAAAQAGVKPEECVVVEDSDTGAEAVFRAGMACFLLREKGQKMPHFWPEKNFIQITHLSEILPILQPALSLDVTK